MGASPPSLCAPSSSFFPSVARPPLLAVSPLPPCWPPWALRVLWRCEGVGSSPLRWSLLVPWCVFYKLTLLAAILRCGRHHRSRRKAPAPFPLKSISSPPPVCVCVCAFLRQRRSSPCPCRAALRARTSNTTRSLYSLVVGLLLSLSCLLAFTTVPPLLRAGPTVLCCIHPQHTPFTRVDGVFLAPQHAPYTTQHNSHTVPAFLLLLASFSPSSPPGVL